MDKIKYITETIEKYGCFEPADVKSKPISFGKHYIRYFCEDEVYIYNNAFDENMTDNASAPPLEKIKYKNLPTEIINEIYELVVKWNEY